MESDALKVDLNELDSTLDGLEESLQPLLNNAVSATASRIPLLDKAKLYTLATYAIESLLFSCIRLHGQEAKDHAVFKELARIKQYFDKIKAVEEAGMKPSSRLDKGAAHRIVKHALTGNDRIAEQRAGVAWAGSKRKFDEQDGPPADQHDSNATRSSGAMQNDQAVSASDLVDEVSEKAARKAARKAEKKAERSLRKSRKTTS